MKQHIRLYYPIYLIVLALMGWIAVSLKEVYLLTMLYPLYLVFPVFSAVLIKYRPEELKTLDVDVLEKECNFFIFILFILLGLLVVMHWLHYAFKLLIVMSMAVVALNLVVVYMSYKKREVK